MYEATNFSRAQEMLDLRKQVLLVSLLIAYIVL